MEVVSLSWRDLGKEWNGRVVEMGMGMERLGEGWGERERERDGRTQAVWWGVFAVSKT